MNARFYLILALLVLLYGAWAYLAHNNGYSEANRHLALSRLPVYAYVADTTYVKPILSELNSLKSIDKITHETGMSAAKELIGAYNLPLDENMIADYSFPDVITITFKPIHTAIAEKGIAMNVLRSKLQDSDIDSQSSAYSEIVQDLEAISHSSIVFTIYAAVMMLMIFLFSRISYELHIYLKQKRKMVSVVDIMRHNRLNASHSWMMLLLPVGFVAGVYYAGWYLKYWPMYAAWYSFAAMAATALIGTLVIYFVLRVYEHDSAMQDVNITVVSKPLEPGENEEANS